MTGQIQLAFPKGESWQWVEVYDNNAIAQFNENGVSRHFHDIKQEKLKMLIMIHITGKRLIIPKDNENNWRLIHFYRRGKRFNLEEEVVGEFGYPVVGYQITKNGTNFKYLMALLDNGDTQVLYK